MRVFWLAVLFFGITLGCIWWGGWHVNRICDGLLAVLEEMSAVKPGDLASYSALYDRFEGIWDSGEMWLHILVGHDAADSVEELFQEMGLRYLCKDEVGYGVTLEKLSLQIEKIKDIQDGQKMPKLKNPRAIN